MQPDIEQLKATYKNLTDDKLASLALFEADSLRPEALKALMSEIKNRGFDENIIRAVNAGSIIPGSDEFAQYVSIIRSLPCPVCGAEHLPLNAAEMYTVTSFIVFTAYKSTFLIACPACLKKAVDQATFTTRLFGWWGLPWGIFRSVQALNKNSKALKKIELGDPTETLISFIKTNIVVIESIRNDRQSLRLMLSGINNRDEK